MKTNKLIAAGAMALSMAMTPMASLINAMPIAAQQVTQAVVNNTTDHTYTAYQVFSGTQATGSTALGDVEWGSAITEEAATKIINELKSSSNATMATVFKDVTSAAEVASTLAENTQYAKAFAEIVDKYVSGTGETISANEQKTMTAGYYLLKDTTEFSDDQENTYVNLSLLQVTNDRIDIEKKNDIPTVTKKVSDEVENNQTAFQDEADHEIGEIFEFELTGTIGTNDYMSSYKTS